MTGLSAAIILAKLGPALVTDSRISSEPWDALAILAKREGKSRSGYRYFGEDGWEAQLPSDMMVKDLFRHLHAAMKAEGNDWKCALFTIKRSDMQLNVDFEYDDPDRWKFTVQGVEGIKAYAMSLRPD